MAKKNLKTLSTLEVAEEAQREAGTRQVVQRAAAFRRDRENWHLAEIK